MNQKVRQTLKSWEVEFLKKCPKPPTYNHISVVFGHGARGYANIFRRLKRAYLRGGWPAAEYRYRQMAKEAFEGRSITDNFQMPGFKKRWRKTRR